MLMGSRVRLSEVDHCEFCGSPWPVEARDAHCANCRGKRWRLAWSRGGYVHQGAVRAAVVGFKFDGQFYHRGQLVDWLVNAYDDWAGPQGTAADAGQWSAVVPVPLHWMRRWWRGFNQAEELARGLARARGLDFLPCLHRVRRTAQQTRLSREERWQNLDKAFAVKGQQALLGCNVLLIDDVITTGATSEFAARCLLEAGAASVAALTVARG